MSLRTCSTEEERLYFGRLVETQSTPRECIIKSNVYARGKLKAVIETASAQDCKLVLKYGTPSQAETMRWLVLAEPMGRINQYLASDGSKVIKMDYTPYGLTKGSSLSGSESRITARSFGGLYFDKDTGLFYSNARLYEPRLGRFLSSDKNDELQAGSQYLNRYSYALNNPLRYGDSTGFVPGEYSVSSPSERAGREKFFNEKKEWADRGIERSRGEREIREGRYNGRERMESLPKLELPKIGDSYSRSSERSYSVLPRPPVAPVGESIDRNVASQLVGSGNGFDVDFAIWVAMVAPGSFWDYKTQGSFYEEAGNFNYGATGAALGLPESVLLRAAGAVQECCGAYKPEFGHAWDSTGSFGDDPRDQRDIRLGIEYTRHRDLIRFLDGEW